jgi:hypothetical protein
VALGADPVEELRGPAIAVRIATAIFGQKGADDVRVTDGEVLLDHRCQIRLQLVDGDVRSGGLESEVAEESPKLVR